MTPREGATLGSLLGLVVGAVGGDLVAALFTPEHASSRKAERLSRSVVAFGALSGTVLGAVIGAGPEPTVAGGGNAAAGTGAIARR